jgi:hypothetical protein
MRRSGGADLGRRGGGDLKRRGDGDLEESVEDIGSIRFDST